MRLQAMMATYGIQTQTPHEVEPVQIWSSNQLVNVYRHLGVNKKLKLIGRPMRPIGALGTSKVIQCWQGKISIAFCNLLPGFRVYTVLVDVHIDTVFTCLCKLIHFRQYSDRLKYTGHNCSLENYWKNLKSYQTHHMDKVLFSEDVWRT